MNIEKRLKEFSSSGSEAYTRGIHKPIIYGDYFFVEAIFKLKGNDFLPW